LAVGGPFLHNHTLIIEPMDGGKVFWDGKQILQDFPSEFLLKGFVRVNFNSSDEHIDDAQRNFPTQTVKARLPRLVHLTVNRWAKHIDAIIRMVQQPDGQDGHCGNFNGDPDDDTLELIGKRAGAPVPAEASLFPPRNESGSVSPAPEKNATLADCPSETKVKAQSLCRVAFSGTTDRAQEQVAACIFDVCFGGKEFAEEDAATVLEMEDEEEKEATEHEAEE
jgi:hypothetical protein